MNDRELLQQQMLELIYGLLSDEESAELVDRISSDGELAREYAELKERTELLAEVTRINQPQPDYDKWKREADRNDDRPTPKGAATWTSRTLQVVAALAACLLIAALGYPRLSIDTEEQTLAMAKQQQSLANNFLSVSVSGPSLMAADVRNDFYVSVENAADEPVDAEVEYTFKSPEGNTVYYGLTQAVNGQVVCQIPPDEVSSAAKLEVVAKHGQSKSELGLDLAVAPPKPIAVLQTDREMVEPGELLNFRAVVLDPQTNRDQSANVDFVWSFAQGGPKNHIASAESSTLKGVAQGQMMLPADERTPIVELGVQSPQLQNAYQQRAVPVVDNHLNGDDAYLAESQRRYESVYSNNLSNNARAALLSRATALPPVEAKPEGGQLVAGVKNRLRYMANRVDADQPETAPQFQINGAPEAQVAASNKPEQAYGYFEFVPEAMQDYTLEVSETAKDSIQQSIAQALPLPAALQINNGVAPADQPLEVEVRVAQPNTTLALVAGDDYATIGHNVWNVGVNAPITQPVQLDLPAEATGAQRVRLYSIPQEENDEDTADQKPQLIAERIIYRIPVQRYDIAVDGLPTVAQPGQKLDLQVAVTDEYDSPAPATLGVQMERLSDVLPQSQQPLGLEGELFLNRRVQVPRGAAGMPDNVRDLEQDTVWFDQVLALSSWRNDATQVDSMGAMAFGMAPAADALPDTSVDLPLLRRSNKKAIATDYQKAIAALHSDWENQLEQVRLTSSWLLSIAGSVLIVCLIALAVLQGMSKIKVWGPGLLVALGAILWGMMSLNLSLPSMSTTKAIPDMVALNEPIAKPMMADRHDLSDAKAIIEERSLPDGALRKGAPKVSAAKLLQPAAEFQRNGIALEQQQINLKTGRPSVDNLAKGGYGGAMPGAGMPGAMRSQARAADAGMSGIGDMRGMGMEGMGMQEPRRAMELKAQTADNPIPAESESLRRKLLPQPILWQPRLSTNSDGRVSIPVDLPQEPGRYRLLIDAHGSGRIGTVVRYIEVAPLAVAEPVTPASEPAAEESP
ncbi:hypothetical protein AB1L30_22290 [Bremerella sp. JC817]|uniref:hypothetical protein n=1 Tax=Bremerella sp. JC817 TaxID=3231756 RepID=UPI003457EE55